MVFRVRERLIRQRTQAINALRGHLSEFGQIVPQRYKPVAGRENVGAKEGKEQFGTIVVRRDREN